MRRLATAHGCCKCKLTGPRQRNATTSLQDAAEPLHVRLRTQGHFCAALAIRDSSAMLGLPAFM